MVFLELIPGGNFYCRATIFDRQFIGKQYQEFVFDINTTVYYQIAVAVGLRLVRSPQVNGVLDEKSIVDINVEPFIAEGVWRCPERRSGLQVIAQPDGVA